MELDKIKKRIGKLLGSDKRWPVIVDFPNRIDLRDFKEHFNVSGNNFLSAEKFCGKDGTFKLEEFINAIEHNNENTFIICLTAFLKIQGELYTRNILKSILSNSRSGHVILITYQCRTYLNNLDDRFTERNQILLADGKTDKMPVICFVAPAMKEAIPNIYEGFEKIGCAVEECQDNIIYLSTCVEKSIFEKPIFNLKQMNNGYEILNEKDSRTAAVDQSCGTAEQWNEVLKQMKTGDWTSVIESQIGCVSSLHDCISKYYSFTDYQKWLFFIALHIFPAEKNNYLQQAVYDSSNYKTLIKSLFEKILAIDFQDSEFRTLYFERKKILENFNDSLNEVFDYCDILSGKEENAIYYLTDLTQLEKERIIEWLNTYGEKYNSSQLQNLLKDIYPDLSDYLVKYYFRNDLLDRYFEKYKYLKVINKLSPDFVCCVEKQSCELGFVDALDSRSSIIDKLNLNKEAHAYFLDALGVEYLGFIQAKCNRYGLSANISYGRCELPSLTSFNKDFVPVFKDRGCEVTDIKDLDEIKHHGEDSFNYEKVKTPLYLIKELEIIDNLLKIIREKINNHRYQKAIIVSDHGASRLAVLHETENFWKMATQGKHSGRCCPQNEIDTKPNASIEAGNFWVLTNYDRFQGGRKANVEVHGGASLEEVAVPIIEITLKQDHVDAFITDESKVITLAAKEYPIIRIYVKIDANNIVIEMLDKYYDVSRTAVPYYYEVALPDCTKKGTYSINIMKGSEIIASNLTFEVKKKGMSEVNLFD